MKARSCSFVYSWQRLPQGVCLLCAWLLVSLAVAAAAEPALPHGFDDVSMSSSGSVVAVQAGADLQAVLEQAEPGSIIELAAGAVFEGPFVLPNKQGSDWITIRSSQWALLPPAGVRVRQTDVAAMATLTAASGAVLSTAPGAHHFRFVGIAIRPGSTVDESGSAVPAFIDALIMLGAVPTSLDDVPHHLVFEHCWLQADPLVGGRRGIVMNAAYTTLADSHLAGFRMAGEDSQAVIGWAGPGPFRILNNYLEAAGENLMFGGGDPAIAGLVPADIEIRGNHFAKLPQWRVPDSAGNSPDWNIKNLLELKNARRVLIDGNLFEYNWAAAQDGYAILFTVRNQDGTAPWSVVEDVSFSNNIVRHVGNGINLLGHDDNAPSTQTRRIAIRNNLFADLGGSWGEGTLLQLLDGVDDVHVEHNTVLNDGRILWSEGRPHEGFVFRSNIVRHNDYGMIGDAAGSGNDTLQRYFDVARVTDNLLIGAPAARYPRGNDFPVSVAEVGFRDAGNSDYRLLPASPWYSNASGGAPGVDYGALCGALSASELPTWCAPQQTP